MERRCARWSVLAAILVSTSLGSAYAEKSMGIRKLVGAKPKMAAGALVPIEWQCDLRTAHRVAQKTGRPMLIVVCGKHCVPCRQLKSETLANRSLATYINTSFVPILLNYDLDEHKRAADILEVKVLPTCVVLSPEVDVLQSIEGFVKPAEFTRSLHLAIDEQRALAAEVMDGDGVDR